MHSDDFEIRAVTAADARAVAALSEELGYPVDPGVMEERIKRLIQTGQDAIFVACHPPMIVAAWIDLGIEFSLASGSRASIRGLVVGSAFRSSGIGRALVSKAEEWARAQGLDTLLVRSNIVREAAHRFYLKNGFSAKKTSSVFEKKLIPQSADLKLSILDPT